MSVDIAVGLRQKTTPLLVNDDSSTALIIPNWAPLLVPAALVVRTDKSGGGCDAEDKDAGAQSVVSCHLFASSSPTTPSDSKGLLSTIGFFF